MKRIIKIEPSHPEIYYHLGFAHAAAGDYRAAIKALKSYLELNPDAMDRAQVEQQIRLWSES